MGKSSAFIAFVNVDGGIMFKVFVGRDETRALRATNCSAFTRWPIGSRPPARPSRFRRYQPGDDHAANVLDSVDPLAWGGGPGVAASPGAALAATDARAAAARPVALGHVHECGHRGEGGDGRAGVRLAGDLDDLARQDHRASPQDGDRQAAPRLLETDTVLAKAEQESRGGKDAVAQIIQSAAREAALSGGHFDDGLKERVALRLERVEAAMSRRIARGTGVLATIGATAPFVGLFGTVWGIMNSFIGISEANTTNLAVVAPGIAEALLATALGLVAAIPAVVIYNHLTRTDLRPIARCSATPRRR